MKKENHNWKFADEFSINTSENLNKFEFLISQIFFGNNFSKKEFLDKKKELKKTHIFSRRKIVEKDEFGESYISYNYFLKIKNEKKSK